MQKKYQALPTQSSVANPIKRCHPNQALPKPMFFFRFFFFVFVGEKKRRKREREKKLPSSPSPPTHVQLVLSYHALPENFLH
jgi:hypothetical protein